MYAHAIAQVEPSVRGIHLIWKFQSPDQIKELVINDKKEEAQQRIYAITLKLQDARVPKACKADAVVTYEKIDSAWKIKGVGLKSIMRIE